MSVSIVYETHSISEDNERGIATGWLDGRLSQKGRELAKELGARWSAGEVDAVFTSDLGRAAETAEIAFGNSGVPVHKDRRLRECNYGELNGMPVERLQAERLKHVDDPFPGGESYGQVVERTRDFLHELARDWDGKRVVLIGHSATRWALDHLIHGRSLAEAIGAPFAWQEGWSYVLEPQGRDEDPEARGGPMNEEVLPRSRTHDSVVRVDDTVRRPTGPWTATIHAYLKHLEAEGFSGAPRALGIDDAGREILTFLHGDVPFDPEWEPGMASLWPVQRRGLELLDRVGASLRDLHEASAGFTPTDPLWMQHDAPMRPEEVVCHGDVGPWNTVFVNDLPVAFIDWDGAHPNLPVLELADAIWNFVPLGADPTDRNHGFPTDDEIPDRVARLCRAYGVTERETIRWALRERGIRGTQVFRFWPIDTAGAARALEGSARGMRWLAENEDNILRGLSV